MQKNYSLNPACKYALLFLISFFLKNQCLGQNIFQVIKKNVGLLQYSYQDFSGQHIVIGTGTIIVKPLDGKNDSGYFFIVTNKHVLPDFNRSKYIEFSVMNPDSSKNPFTKFKIPIYQTDGKYDEHVIVSDDEDLAIIEFGNKFSGTELNSNRGQLLATDFLATKRNIKDKGIGIGDMIFFEGYPSFFYEENNISPVFRTGYIATDPIQSYHFNQYLRNYIGRNILNGFLIDGNVFGGSSGSLVCLYPTLINQTSQNHPQLDRTKGQAWILGILTESYYDIGTKEGNTQRVNLGGVISSEKIIELIHSYKYRGN